MHSKIALILASGIFIAASAFGQQVTLPLPRLLTVMPMGGQAGTNVEVTITGENIEDVTELTFSSPKIAAKPVAGTTNKFAVSIAADAPVGVYDARSDVPARCVLSAGVFGEQAARSDSCEGQQHRGDSDGAACWHDLQCDDDEAGGGFLFLPRREGQSRRHRLCGGRDSLTAHAGAHPRGCKGRRSESEPHGRHHRLHAACGRHLSHQGERPHLPGRRASFLSSRAAKRPRAATTADGNSQLDVLAARKGLAATAAAKETEPNNKDTQKITLPCDIAGAFYPAADVDTFEFTAKKGETWWVEVASERLGLNTDPFVLVQQVKDGKFTDVAELYDIAPPMKVTSNGYSYDGLPYRRWFAGCERQV